MNTIMNNLLVSLKNIGQVFWNYSARAFIQSSVLIILLLIIDFILRKHVRAVFRYCVWMLVFVKLVLPPSFTLPTGIGYWWSGFEKKPALHSLNEGRWTRDEGREMKDETASAVISRVEPSAIVAEPAVSAEPSVSSSPQLSPIVNTPLTWQAVVFVLWLVGVLIFSVLLIQRVFFVRGLIAQSSPAESSLPELLGQCRLKLGLRRDIQIRLSTTVLSPAVCGLFRPIILMPKAILDKLPQDKLRAVLIHELAHIKRGDLWVNLVQTILQVIYFYNPFVWLANTVVRRIREQAVDEMVLVALGAEAKSYSNTLIDIAETAFWKANFSLRLIGVAESKKALEGRIKYMLTHPIPKSAKIGFLGLLTVIVIAAVLLPMAAAEDRGQKTDDRVEKQFAATLPKDVIVELVGLCEYPSEGKKWWKPDGTELSQEIRVSHRGRVSASGKPYAVAVKATMPEDATFKWGDIKGAGSVGDLEAVDSKGQPVSNMHAFMVYIDEKLTSTSIQLRVASGPWQTRARNRGNYLTSTAGIVFSVAYESDGGVTLTVSDEHLDLDHRIIAIDTDGKEHVPEKKPWGSAGNVRQTTAHFDNLKLDQIKEFQFQTRPYHWVMFKNVSLQPNFKTDVQIEMEKPDVQLQVVDAFGEVVERVIYSSEIGKDFFFDLDSNEAFTPPSYLTRSSPPEEVIEWSLKHGIDFLNDKGRFEITPQTIFVKVANNLWYGSAEDVLDTLKTGYPEEVIPDYETIRPGLQFSQNQGDEPKTYVFKTREGGIGLLQLLESKNSNVKIRYKMLKQQSDKNLAILTDKPPVVLDLDSGRLMQLDKDWPDEYEVGWDNDEGGTLFTKLGGPVKMLPIIGAKNFDDAKTIATQKIESLKQGGIPGIHAEQSKYILINTSQDNIVVVEIEEFDQSKTKIRWQIIKQPVEKSDVQIDVEGQLDTSQMPAAMVGTWFFDNLQGDDEQMAVFPDGKVVVLYSNGHKDQIRYIDGFIKLAEYNNAKCKMVVQEDGTLVQYFNYTEKEQFAKRWNRIDIQPRTNLLRSLTGPSSNQTKAELLKQIEEVTDVLIKAFNAGDIDTILSYYSDDGMSLPDQHEAAIGKGALHKLHLEAKEEGVKIYSIKGLEQQIWDCGDLVFEAGRCVASLKSPKLRFLLSDWRKYVTIWARQPDGSLKIKLDSWNPDVIPASEGTSESIVPKVTVIPSRTPDDGMNAIYEQVKQYEANFHKMFIERDSDAAAKFYADDAVLIPWGADIVKGKKDILEHIKKGMNEPPILVDINQHVVHIEGNDRMLFVVNLFSWMVKDKSSVQNVTIPGKGVHVWTHQNDGSWKILLDLHNPSVPMQQ